jgi:ABC-type Na+ transport system ATPase subunit NatA
MQIVEASWGELIDQKRQGDIFDLRRQGIEKQIAKLSEKLQISQKGDFSKGEAELAIMVNDADELTRKRSKTVEDRTYNEAISEMLKDTGIKTKVIRQYLPVMNRLINTYLDVFDLFVAFHLDDALNETLRSRHRDKFTYPSFSEGEKARIDLALLFAWREVARMRNSVNTNLLVLDEVFDSSLDVEGAESLQKILRTLDEDTRVVVITHKTDVLEGEFERKIEFRKPNNFSQMCVSC